MQQKISEVKDLAKNVMPFLKSDTAIVSLQDGICEDFIAEIIGTDRTIGCVVDWGTTMHALDESGSLQMVNLSSYDSVNRIKVSTTKVIITSIIGERQAN